MQMWEPLEFTNIFFRQTVFLPTLLLATSCCNKIWGSKFSDFLGGGLGAPSDQSHPWSSRTVKQQDREAGPCSSRTKIIGSSAAGPWRFSTAMQMWEPLEFTNIFFRQRWEPLEFTNLFSGKVGNHLNSQISFNADVGTTWIREAQPVSCPTAHQQTSNPIVDRQLQVNRKRETIGVKVVASQAWGVKPCQMEFNKNIGDLMIHCWGCNVSHHLVP